MKTLSTDFDLSALIYAGDTVMWGQAGAEPVLLTRALMDQRQAIGRLRAFIGISWADTVDVAYADCVDFISYCGGGKNRALARAGLLDILPGHYSELPDQIRSGALRIDVLMLQVAPPDSTGRYSLSMACEYLAAAISTARIVIAEVNDQAPWTWGSHSLTEADIDFALHSSRHPLTAPATPAGNTEEVIARNVASLIGDGATLQCGIGSLPEAVLGHLGDRRDLGLHSGAMGDRAAELMRTGVMNNARKSIDRGIAVVGVLMGSEHLLRFVHRNPAVELRAADYTHHAEVLARIDNLVSINSAIDVDLTGQINAEVAGGSYVGAVGGGLDFARGARRSKGGLPIIALPSRAAQGALTSSRIVASLTGPVTTPRSDAGIIVTEHGIADLRGLTLAQRVRRMLDIAHPDDREHLEREAHPGLRAIKTS